jgi:hypothetical protein
LLIEAISSLRHKTGGQVYYFNKNDEYLPARTLQWQAGLILTSNQQAVTSNEQRVTSNKQLDVLLTYYFCPKK